MRAVIQRVRAASVTVAGHIVGAIDQGLLVLLGVGSTDTIDDAAVLATKTADLRIFADAAGKFNHSVQDVGGAVLVVSQFTLYADTRKGRRPSFTDAAPPSIAEPLVVAYAEALQARQIAVAMGQFGAMMQVQLTNDGPVTIILDTEILHARRRADSE
jgi:D-tyrosyl-tRNA(Tyr) deacylase